MRVLELERVSKSFPRGFLGKRHRVLEDLSFHIEQGEVFGLLGQNGAGKTTTMRVILGLSRPDSGRISVFGSDRLSRASRGRIGFLSDEVGLYPFLNAEEMLRFTGRLFRLDGATIHTRTDRLLDKLELDAARKVPIKKYSKGMRQRLGIAVALLNDPELLILDEPYSGLDPIGRRQVRKLLLSLKSRGKTIIMSSHIVPDVEAICDRVGILSDGHIKQCLDLKDIYAQKTRAVEITVTHIDPRTFEGMEGVQKVYSNEGATVLRSEGGGMVKEVISKVYAFGGEINEVKPLKFDLEDFLIEALALETNEQADEPMPAEENIYASNR